jgi:hypothetical protein
MRGRQTPGRGHRRATITIHDIRITARISIADEEGEAGRLAIKYGTYQTGHPYHRF